MWVGFDGWVGCMIDVSDIFDTIRLPVLPLCFHTVVLHHSHHYCYHSMLRSESVYTKIPILIHISYYGGKQCTRKSNHHLKITSL